MIFNKTVLNVLSNFIPHKVIFCDDKDPLWFNGKIKSLFNEKLRTYNAYRKNSNNIQLRNNLRSLQQRLRDLIDNSKQKYFLRLSQKLTTIQKSTKVYWALLKIFLNDRKILLFHHYFTTTNLLLILRKKLNFLIPFSQSNAPNQKSTLLPN